MVQFLCSMAVPYFRQPICDLHNINVTKVLDMTTWTTLIVSVVLPFLPKYLSKLGGSRLIPIGVICGGIVFALTPYSPNALILSLMIALSNLFAVLL